MKIQIAIAGIIILMGVIFFMPNTAELIPNVPEVYDSVKKDLSKVQKDAEDVVDINSKINSLKDDSKMVTQKLNEIVPDRVEKVLFEKMTDESVTDSNTSFSNSGHESSQVDSSKQSIEHSKQQTTQTPLTKTGPEEPKIMFYDTLSLVTKKQPDGSITVKYEDTSQQTISVTITMQNENKQLFSGKFFLSSFETSVFPTEETPYSIDMVVEHAQYGTVSASAFNSLEDKDAQINGAFKSS